MSSLAIVVLSTASVFGNAAANAPSNEQHLRAMVGEWIGDWEAEWVATADQPSGIRKGDRVRARQTIDWGLRKNVVENSWTVKVPKKNLVVGPARLITAWDASANKLRTYWFDSVGGIAQGHVKKKDGKWIIRSRYVAASGDTFSSTRTIEVLDDDTHLHRITASKRNGEPYPENDHTEIWRRK